MKKEFVTSVYILDNRKVLLIFHPKLKKWLPPGGHIEADETPPEAAKREVLEETGIDIEFLKQENVWVSYWNACSFERPYLCLLEEIPAHKENPPHQHMDFVYVARPLSFSLCADPMPRWFSLDELEQLKPEEEIFNETLHIIKHLFVAFEDVLALQTINH